MIEDARSRNATNLPADDPVRTVAGSQQGADRARPTLLLPSTKATLIDHRARACYMSGMQLADIDAEFPPGEVTFEMSNLSPRETGLDFAVFVSPKMASHAARIKVTQPPWGSKPEAVYTLSPFERVAGEAWLSRQQENDLRMWVEVNLAALLAYWNGDILYDQDLRAVLVPRSGTR